MADLCTHRVAAVLLKHEGRDEYAMFGRNTYPPGVAGPAGHIDKGELPMVAAERETFEEIGVPIMGTLLPLVGSEWVPFACRRKPRHDPGHYWWVYTGVASGELAPSARETKNAGWLTVTQVTYLAMRTISCAARDDYDSFNQDPGLEPVWLPWIVRAGILNTYISPRQLEMVDRFGMNFPPEEAL